MGNYCCGCVPITDGGLGTRIGSTDDAHATRLADTSDSAVEIKAGLCNADPITKQGKRIQMAQMLCVPLVPITILVVQACLSLGHSVASKVQLFASTCSNFLVPSETVGEALTLYDHIKTAEQWTIIQRYGDWYTGR